MVSSVPTKMKQLFPQPLAVTVAGLFVAGCGDPLATGDYAPPYVTLDGNVAYSTPNPTTTPVSIVVLWQNDRDGASSYAGQLGVLDKDLTTFTLGLNALPPAPAIHSVAPLNGAVPASGLDPSTRYALGTILAFADNNGNGQLDLVPSTNENSPDRVLGAITNVDLFFLAAGHPADPSLYLDLFPSTTGFSLVQRPTLKAPSFFDCGHFDSVGHFTDLCFPTATVTPAAELPLSTAVTMTLSSDAVTQQELQNYACASFWGLYDYPDTVLATVDNTCDGGGCQFCRGYDCPLDVPPPGVPFTCNSDGTAYVYELCTPDPMRCGTRFCHYGHGEKLLTTGASPVGWPCA